MVPPGGSASSGDAQRPIVRRRRRPRPTGTEYGSRGWRPASTSRPRRTSATRGPSGRRPASAGTTPARPAPGIERAAGTTPADGLIEAMPQHVAGLRSEPPMSLPRPIGLIPAASATASPPDEPPAVRPRSHGLRVSPNSPESVCTRSAMSGQFVRAIGIAPGRLHPLDDRRVDRRHGLGERRQALVGRRAGEVDVLLDRERHAVQRAERAGGGDGPRRPPCGGPRPSRRAPR